MSIKAPASAPANMDGSKLRVAIVHARWNPTIIDPLVRGTQEKLLEHGVQAENIDVSSCPGSFELPFAASNLVKANYDAVVAIGVLIKGETMHFEYICDAVSHGLMKVQLDSGVPVIFGVLTCLTDEQAKARAGLTSGKHNHGESWGEAAVEMALKNTR